MAYLFISTVPKYLLIEDEASKLLAQGEAEGKIKFSRLWRKNPAATWDRDEQGIVIPAWILRQK